MEVTGAIRQCQRCPMLQMAVHLADSESHVGDTVAR